MTTRSQGLLHYSRVHNRMSERDTSRISEIQGHDQKSEAIHSTCQGFQKHTPRTQSTEGNIYRTELAMATRYGTGFEANVSQETDTPPEHHPRNPAARGGGRHPGQLPARPRCAKQARRWHGMDTSSTPPGIGGNKQPAAVHQLPADSGYGTA